MTKPVFGKWYTLEDCMPEVNIFVLIHVPSRPWGCNGSRGTHFFKTARLVKQSDSWIKLGHPELKFEEFGPGYYDLEEVEKWMPLPEPGKDAFTELRALVDEAEQDNREKYPDESNMTDILQRMKEVIGE